MNEQCNIFIRQEQAPLAKNEFVGLLNSPRCTASAQTELDYTTSERDKKECPYFSLLSPVYALGTDKANLLTTEELTENPWKGGMLKSTLQGMRGSFM